MKITRSAILLTVIVVLFGCASASPGRQEMKQENYHSFSKFAVGVQKCFEAEYINAKLHADAKDAFSILVNTWRYDNNNLQSMMQYGYTQTSATPEYCRTIESEAHQVISSANRHRQNIRDNQQTTYDIPIQSTINKPIFCNRIGTVTMCN